MQVSRGFSRPESNPDFGGNIDDRAFAYGLSLSGVIPVGSDQFLFQVNGGDGIGRYLGFQLTDAVVDGDSIEPIPSYGAYAAYTHSWSERWRSTLVYSFRHTENDVALTGLDATKQAQSVHVNLLYSPVPPVTFGVEYIFAEREEESSADGNINRVQFSGEYLF